VLVPRFYFDIRDGDQFIRDEYGLDYPNIETARDSATIALAEMAKEALPRAERHHIAIRGPRRSERAAAYGRAHFRGSAAEMGVGIGEAARTATGSGYLFRGVNPLPIDLTGPPREAQHCR